MIEGNVLKIIKKQNWGLENFGFEKKMVTDKYKISKNNSGTFPWRNNIFHIFILNKIKYSLRNYILKVVKIQNWGALENFGFEKKKWWQTNTKFRNTILGHFLEETTFLS